MSTVQSELTLYHVLEQHLRTTEQPVTCVDLYDHPDVKAHADSVNKVSDTLGHLWRRGYLDRFVAPKTPHSQAKYAYIWKGPRLAKPAPKSAVPAQPPAAAHDGGARPTGVVPILSRPTIEISQDGANVVIDLPQLQIIIRART